MSKFFAQGNISDEEENSNQSDNENKDGKQPSYQYDFLDERWSNEKRVVRTEKEKKWHIIKDMCKKIEGALNNQDFEKVWALLQEMLRQIEKSSKLIEKEGYPPFFLKCLKRVNDEIVEFSKSEARKKMKKHSATAFNTMNQKLKKIYPDFEEQIKELLEKGDDDEDQDEMEEEESSSESSSDEDDIALLDSPDPIVRRRYWLKKAPKQQDKKQEEQKKKEEKREEKRQDKPHHKKEVKVTNVPDKKKTTEIQSIKDAENRMREIRKKFMKLYNQEERQEYLLTLDKINQSTKDAKDFEKLSFYLLEIPIRIDVCRQMKLTHFPRTQWLNLYNTIKRVHYLLRESEEDDVVQNIRLFDETTNENEAATVTEGEIYISLKTYLILIESEIKKSLIYINSNDIEYFQRLQDLIGLVDLMYKISKELQIKDGFEKEAAELAFKVLENAYFMDGPLIKRIKSELKADVEFLELADQQKIKEYGNLILKYQRDEQVKIKTLLYLIYNHSINGREKGKQILTISTVSETIVHQEYYTQVLYNRVLVQVGLAAFRQGNMFEVQQFLYEMCSIAKSKESTKDVVKEFLAQGYSRFTNEKDIPRAKILPIYLHLNVEVVECLELIASMLLQTPYTLTEGGRITSKTFRKFIYEYERSFFIKENFNNKDLIYTASQALKEGDWEVCYNNLNQLSIWKVLPDVEYTKENLLRVVKEQSLKCYLIGNRKCFKSIALSGLAGKFSLEQKAIRKYICKLISEKILQGSITSSGYLVFVQKKQNEMQKICETFFSKVKQMNTTTESWLNQKFSAGADSDEEKDDAITARRSNLAINEKLKAILSKRNEKF